MTDLKHLFSVSVHRRLNDADTEHAVTSTWLGVQCCVGNLPSLLTYTTQQWSMMANIWGTAQSPGDKRRCMLMTSKQTGVVVMIMTSKQTGVVLSTFTLFWLTPVSPAEGLSVNSVTGTTWFKTYTLQTRSPLIQSYFETYFLFSTSGL